jgi:hypothetical protein
LNKPSRLTFRHHDLELEALSGVNLAAVRPIEGRDGLWLTCSETGALIEISPNARKTRIVAQISADAIDFDGSTIAKPKREWKKGAWVTLKVSRDGEFAAVANTYGDKCVIVDLLSGDSTKYLNRGKYHNDVSCFPIEFIERNGHILIVHGTGWNRLDVSDARTGDLLTAREPTSYRRGEQRPAHYLDYFHCSLSVSPNQRFIVDNGWVWAPIGVVTSWDLQCWLSANAWESEDGESKKTLCWRSYYWDGPVCWLNDNEVAVWGYGRDDEWLLPAVCIYDIQSGEQIRWFPGPKGALVYDDYLFSLDDGDGASVWDAVTGERLLHDTEMHALAYHPGSKEFLLVWNNGRARVSRLVND